MWWIILYLIGVVACWFFIGYQRDNTECDFEKWPAFAILFSWIFIAAVFIIAIFGMLFEWIGRFKIFNPSLKYFKKNDKHREK